VVGWSVRCEYSGGQCTTQHAGHETISQFVLAAGTVIIEVYDFEMSLVTNPQPRCMTVQITGN
jgi:hypothetical protein